VGTIQLITDLYYIFPFSGEVPVYNMVPSVNAPARFGFNFGGVPITLTGNVRNGGDFGISVNSTDIPIALPIDALTLTFWGNPSAIP
jgi:hypothetical protein